MKLEILTPQIYEISSQINTIWIMIIYIWHWIREVFLCDCAFDRQSHCFDKIRRLITWPWQIIDIISCIMSVSFVRCTNEEHEADYFSMYIIYYGNDYVLHCILCLRMTFGVFTLIACQLEKCMKTIGFNMEWKILTFSVHCRWMNHVGYSISSIHVMLIINENSLDSTGKYCTSIRFN